MVRNLTRCATLQGGLLGFGGWNGVSYPSDLLRYLLFFFIINYKNMNNQQCRHPHHRQASLALHPKKLAWLAGG